MDIDVGPSVGVTELVYIVSVPQKLAGLFAFICALLAVIMTIAWANHSSKSEGYMGGLNFGTMLFNWHPVLMVSGLIFCLMSSLLAYRMLPIPKKTAKAVHGVIHTLAVVCSGLGISAVVGAHNYTNHNTYNKYLPSLYTIHSILGVAALGLYCVNYLLALTHFVIPWASKAQKRSIKPYHVFFGTLVLFMSVFAAQTGIMEYTREANCSYTVSSADVDPASNYHRLPEGCKLANGIGMMIFTAVLLCAYALFGPPAVKEVPLGTFVDEDEGQDL